MEEDSDEEGDKEEDKSAPLPPQPPLPPAPPAEAPQPPPLPPVPDQVILRKDYNPKGMCLCRRHSSRHLVNTGSRVPCSSCLFSCLILPRCVFICICFVSMNIILIYFVTVFMCVLLICIYILRLFQCVLNYHGYVRFKML